MFIHLGQWLIKRLKRNYQDTVKVVENYVNNTYSTQALSCRRRLPQVKTPHNTSCCFYVGTHVQLVVDAIHMFRSCCDNSDCSSIVNNIHMGAVCLDCVLSSGGNYFPTYSDWLNVNNVCWWPNGGVYAFDKYVSMNEHGYRWTASVHCNRCAVENNDAQIIALAVIWKWQVFVNIQSIKIYFVKSNMLRMRFIQCTWSFSCVPIHISIIEIMYVHENYRRQLLCLE